MTLDEAIEHCEQTARSCDGECSDDHHQLAEWLRELKRLREERDEMYVNELIAIIGRDTFKATSKRLRAENDKLRELVKDVQGFHECGKNCSTCPLFYECSKSFEGCGCSGYAIIHERMRGLGIEAE